MTVVSEPGDLLFYPRCRIADLALRVLEQARRRTHAPSVLMASRRLGGVRGAPAHRSVPAVTTAREAPVIARQPDQSPLAVADELGVDDVLVFARDGDRFRIVGGKGRGAGWAEIVEIHASEEPFADRAWRSGMPVRVAGPEPSRIAGPYWARHGIVAPVGQQH